MSSRVDVYRDEMRGLAVAASKAIVYVEGRLCPQLEVRRIVRSPGPEYGWVVVVYNPAMWTAGERVAVERMETMAAMGKSVRIVMPYDAGFGKVQVEELCVFAGHIEGIRTRISGGGESVEITVRDFAAKLGRKTVYGQRVGEGISFATRKTVFNADGQPNASRETATNGGMEYRVFAAESRNAGRWTIAEAVAYLLAEYVSAGELAIPSVEVLEEMFGHEKAGEIDVDGMSVPDAMEKCCEPTGVRFRFEACIEEGEPAERIVLYRDGEERQVELNLQRAGERLSVSRTNIAGIDSEREYYPVTRRYVGRGAVKVYEAAFGLVKAWDGALEGKVQSEYSPSTSTDFESVRDVYRRWCLNEAGDYTDPPYSRGQAYDFASLFEGEAYMQRRREFLKTAEGTMLLEVSYDDGQTWSGYAGSYELFDDECGVWLDDDALSTEMWAAISAGTLLMRMTAAVEGDGRLTVSVADGPVGSCAEVVDEVIDMPQYGYRRAVPTGVLRDDSTAMHAELRRMCEAGRAVIETIDIETPTVCVHYRCGDMVVCSPESRDIIGTRRDSRSTFTIARAEADFARQCTKLKVLRRRR
jgi:hypothetical protein